MPDLRQGCATGKTVEDTAAADALVLFGPWGLGSIEALLRTDAFLVRCIHASKAVALDCCSIDR